MVLRKGIGYRAQCLTLGTGSLESHKERATWAHVEVEGEGLTRATSKKQGQSLNRNVASIQLITHFLENLQEEKWGGTYDLIPI